MNEIEKLRKERDEARAEVERLRDMIKRLRGVLHVVSLDEYESTTSASDKVHDHARRARAVLREDRCSVRGSPHCWNRHGDITKCANCAATRALPIPEDM